MALILEIVHPNGTRSWRRLDAQPLTLGRALGNDVILDDPYVDAKHARVAMDETGGFRLEDLDTVNGLVTNETRIRGVVDLQPGVEVRVGRTTLRFRDSEEAVAPALVDEPAPRPAPVLVQTPLPRRVPTTAGERLGAWMSTKPGQIGVILAAAGVFALSSWLASTSRSSASDALSAAAGFVVLGALWAGVWAVASRAIVHRFNFRAHFAVLSAVSIVGLAWNAIESWLTFFFPDVGFVEVLSTIAAIALFCALIAGHLALSSTMTRRKRWRAGIIVAGSALAIGGLVTMTMEDEFSDVATFPGVLKPLAANWIPTATVDEFGGAMRELKDDVDEIAKKKQEE